LQALARSSARLRDAVAPQPRGLSPETLYRLPEAVSFAPGPCYGARGPSHDAQSPVLEQSHSLRRTRFGATLDGMSNRAITRVRCSIVLAAMVAASCSLDARGRGFSTAPGSGGGASASSEASATGSSGTGGESAASGAGGESAASGTGGAGATGGGPGRRGRGRRTGRRAARLRRWPPGEPRAVRRRQHSARRRLRAGVRARGSHHMPGHTDHPRFCDDCHLRRHDGGDR
jgi:hypothetical protein